MIRQGVADVSSIGFDRERGFGIGEENEHTLDEVGRRFEVTSERIRQIEAKALRRLRSPLRRRSRRGFVEP